MSDNRNYNYIPEKLQETIVSEYLGGALTTQLQKKYHINNGNLNSLFKAKGVYSPRRNQRNGGNSRKNTFDYGFFDELTPKTAYWAGFIFADGNINKSGYATTVSLELGCADKNHLQQFVQDINYSGEIRTRARKPRDMVSISLAHWGLDATLLKWGVIPRKSYNFIPPEIPTDLLPHFLRGWVDGDGNVVADKFKERIVITGNQLALEWFQKTMVELGYKGTSKINSLTRTKAVQLWFRGNLQTREVMGILQAGTSFGLERKWGPAKTYYANIPPKICSACGVPLRQSSIHGFCKPCGKLPENRKLFRYKIIH
jgi:hypothetical protein